MHDEKCSDHDSAIEAEANDTVGLSDLHQFSGDSLGSFGNDNLPASTRKNSILSLEASYFQRRKV